VTNGAEQTIPSQQPVDLSRMQRFFGIFTEPVETFAVIARKPDFWAPLVALIVFVIAITELMLHRISMEEIVRRSIEMSGRANSMTPEQMQKAVEQGAKIGAVFAHLGFVSLVIVLVIVAALGMLILKLVFGHPVGFKTAFSISAYAFLPTIIGAILGMIVIALGDPASFNPQNIEPTNVGFFLSQQSTSRSLYSIATSIDFFTFWVLGLLGIGFAAATGRKARPRSVFFCFLGLWVIWVLIKAGLAAI
jgi:hypothetical protein